MFPCLAHHVPVPVAINYAFKSVWGSSPDVVHSSHTFKSAWGSDVVHSSQ